MSSCSICPTTAACRPPGTARPAAGHAVLPVAGRGFCVHGRDENRALHRHSRARRPVGAVGGSVALNGGVHDYAVDLNLFRGAIEGTKARGPLRFSPGGTPYRICDQHNNFGLWRREMLGEPGHSWDGLPKVGEHAAYFWRLKLAARSRIAHAPAVVVDHDLSGRSGNYKQHRARAGKLQNQWLAAQGIPGGYKQEPSLAVSPNLLAPPERPNVLVLGVGHSGTSILAKMLFAAGWQAGDADAEYGESVSIRA